MCRLFGFRSVTTSQVHRSLLTADNALGVQSDRHPDGWGVAYYVEGTPHVTRSPKAAYGDALFARVSGVVMSQTVLAHVRKATQGEHTVLNCHPFQYGPWVFAHNGDIPNFEAHRARLVEQIDERLRTFILGETDSEVLFFMILSKMKARKSLRGVSPRDVEGAMREVADFVLTHCSGPFPNYLTFLMTDGRVMVAHQGGKELFYSTFKKRCSDRSECPHLAASCEAESVTGYVNHFIVSSEPLQGENVWHPFGSGEVVGVDEEMKLFKAPV